ncbi:MAG: hypothetical protein M5U28_13875 [Sandaracinaceae bacterium]|nr:hypothetical protein [Sandaracinaceae bacterium]
MPRPPRGYWAKLKAGKNVRRPALPPTRPSDEHVWRTERIWGSGGVPPEQAPSVTPAQPLPARAKGAIVRGGLHSMVWGAKEAFAKAPHDREGYLRPERWEVPDVLVSKAAVKRGLAFMNALFLALEGRGYDVVFAPRDRDFKVGAADLPDEARQRWPERPRWRPQRATLVFVGEVAVGLTLVELPEEMPARRLWDEKLWVRDTRKYPATTELDRRVAALTLDRPLLHWLPNERLRLRAYSPYPMTSWTQDWSDGESKLEHEIDSIIAGIEEGARGIPALIVNARREYDEHCRKLEEERRARVLREARERYERASAASGEALLNLVRDWSEAEAIRRFLEAVEEDLDDADPRTREGIAAKVSRAREMLGSPRAADWLAAWTPPPPAPEL